MLISKEFYKILKDYYPLARSCKINSILQQSRKILQDYRHVSTREVYSVRHTQYSEIGRLALACNYGDYSLLDFDKPTVSISERTVSIKKYFISW